MRLPALVALLTCLALPARGLAQELPPPPSIDSVPPPLALDDPDVIFPTDASLEVVRAQVARAAAPPTSPPRYSPAANGALLGELLGLGVGMAIGAVGWSLLIPCEDGGGGRCEHEMLLASATAGALFAPLAAAAGGIAGGELAGQRGLVHGAFQGALTGWLTGVLAVIPAVVSGDDFVAIVSVQVLGMAFSPIFTALLFEGQDAPPVVPTVSADRHGARLGIAGSF